ncbi:MAG: hypothetical protein P8M11_06695 [Planctomycetota bacterium]|nr:hypothetical protein [Planctomycetota bacterium]
MTARTPHLRSRLATPLHLPQVAAAIGVLAIAGCNSSSSPDEQTTPAGTLETKPGGDFFFVDNNFNGAAQDLRISRQYYGRLVNIVAFSDAALEERVTVFRDFVINPKSESGWALPDFELETNPVSGTQSLVIYRNFNDETLGGGRDQFKSLVTLAESGVRPIADNGFVGAGTYSMVPRNSVIVVAFDDLVDPETINQQSVRLLVGEPTIIPFEARFLPDPNHGGLADYDGTSGAEFYSTRLIVDPAVTEVESFNSDPSVAVNTIGFPASQDVNIANVELRFPTAEVAGQQLPLLQNPTAHALTSSSNGSFDFGSPNLDLVRAFRSGGETAVTNDPSNGFLPDETSPTLVGSLSAVILAPTPTADPLEFIIPRIQFTSVQCAQAPAPGDLISQGPYFAEVTGAASVSQGGVAQQVEVRLVAYPQAFDPAQFATIQGPVQYVVPFVPAEDANRSRCFVTVSPAAPDPNNPTSGVLPGATYRFRFSEAIDPNLFEPYESFRLLRTEPVAGTPAPATDFVPGVIRNSVSLQEFRFEPDLPLTHEQGNAESFFLDLPGGDRAPKDLAGNSVTGLLSLIEIQLDATAPDASTGGRVVRFESADEEAPFGDPLSANVIDTFAKPEWFGQIVYDLERGRVRGRPLVRTQVVCSQNNEVVAAMQPGVGTTLPLSPYGARTQILWRYIDFGDDLPLNRDNDVAQDVNYGQLNLDIEGISLSPLGGNPVFESFPEFQMAMAHAQNLPDEVINPLTGALVLPNSGLQNTFDANGVDSAGDPLKIVHPRAAGYTINPGDQTVAPDGTALIPTPMNQGVVAGQKEFYTWRDTSIRARGGFGGGGAPVLRQSQITGLGPVAELETMMGPDCNQPGDPNPFYLVEEVRTVALPLLVEFRCYPTGNATTSNIFAHQLAHTSTLPGFRAYSAGGRDQTGALNIVNPDSENLANGGFDPTSMPAGAVLPGVDNALYFGALDLVVRVSRAHSLFYEALDPLGIGSFSAPTFSEPVIFPEVQPQGTSVEFAYRGAVTIIAIAGEDASLQDAYGDFYQTKPINYTASPMEDPTLERRGNASCWDGSFSYEVVDQNGLTGFLNNDDSWRDDVSDVTGARFLQVQMSFISNGSTGFVPEVAALGLSWRE